MAVNLYDQAAEAPIINTYVPIDFENLYRIGATQKAAVDKAINDLTTAVQTFGEFRSPSTVDTQNYYNMTLGQMQGLINEMSSNPDSMKDPSFRSRFYSKLNSLDYSGLSLLRESANNLREGLRMRAEMEAKGLYNENWDDANISTYDTLGNNAVFSDITPVAYMNADQLSSPYFDNLSKGTIGTVWKDGVKYIATGNTIDDLWAVANSRYSDIVNTPQGQKYYEQFLRQNGGDADKAEQQFKQMIVSSQIDRTLRPKLDIDPVWFAQVKASGNGTSSTSGLAGRLDYIQTSFTRKGMNNVNRILTPEQQIQNNSNLRQLKQDYTDKALKAQQTGSDEDIVAAQQAQHRYYQYQGEVVRRANRKTVLDAFQEKAGFSAENLDTNSDKYNNDLYLNGVEYGLKQAETTIGITGQKDAIVVNLGGLPNTVTNTKGGTSRVFEFNDSKGFLLPETIFKQITSTMDEEGNVSVLPLRGEVTRPAGIGRSNEFPFQSLVESGDFSNVQFIPDGGLIQNGTYDYVLGGKLRIPKEEVERYLGTGVWGNAGSENNNLQTIIAAGADYLFTPFGRYGTQYNLEDKYNAKVVSEKVEDDDVEYYEIPIYKQLPSVYYDGEWWKGVEQSWQNSPTIGGIGGSSQAKEAYADPYDRYLNN